MAYIAISIVNFFFIYYKRKKFVLLQFKLKFKFFLVIFMLEILRAFININILKNLLF